MRARRLQDVSSLEEFKSRVIADSRSGLKGISDVRFSKGMEEFVDYVIQNGTDDQKFAIGWEEPYYGGIPLSGKVKTLVYVLPNGELLLCLLDMLDYLDEKKVKSLYTPNEQLKKASLEDLHDLEMLPKRCHGFPSSECKRKWKIVADDVTRHPIYLNGIGENVGFLYAHTKYYSEIMNERFPGKVIQDRISKYRP
jgi:hypothetical protein